MAKGQARIATLLKKYEDDLLADWMRELKGTGSSKDTRIKDSDLHEPGRDFLSLLQQVAQHGDVANTDRAEWAAMNSARRNSCRRFRAGHRSQSASARLRTFSAR